VSVGDGDASANRASCGSIEMAIRSGKAERQSYTQRSGSSVTGAERSADAVGRRVWPTLGGGDAYENAMCESFFATLECEMLATPPVHLAGRGKNGGLQEHRGCTIRSPPVGIGYLSPDCL